MKNKSKLFFGWWIVIGSVLITATLVPGVMSMANKFLIPVTEDMGISRSAFTLGNAILQSVGIFLAPYITRKLAQGDLRKIQTTSIVVFSLAYMSYGLAQNIVHIYISSLILGVAFLSATIIPISLMITNWFNEKRGLAMSIALAGVGLGGFIFSPLITKWIGIYGWRQSYIIFGLIMLVVGLPTSLFLFRKSPEDKGLEALGGSKSSNEGSVSQGFSLEVKDSFNKPFFKFLLLGMVLNGIINTGSLGQFPPALEEIHGPAKAALIVSMYSLIGILGKLVLGWVNDKKGVTASIIFGCSAFGLGLVFMLVSENTIALYLMTVLYGFGLAIGPVLPPLLTAAIFGKAKYGEAYGYVSSATQLGFTFGSLMVAYIYDLSGSYNIAWLVLFVLTASTMFSWLLSYRKSLQYRIGYEPGKEIGKASL